MNLIESQVKVEATEKENRVYREKNMLNLSLAPGDSLGQRNVQAELSKELVNISDSLQKEIKATV